MWVECGSNGRRFCTNTKRCVFCFGFCSFPVFSQDRTTARCVALERGPRRWISGDDSDDEARGTRTWSSAQPLPYAFSGRVCAVRIPCRRRATADWAACCLGAATTGNCYFQPHPRRSPCHGRHPPLRLACRQCVPLNVVGNTAEGSCSWETEYRIEP